MLNLRKYILTPLGITKLLVNTIMYVKSDLNTEA